MAHDTQRLRTFHLFVGSGGGVLSDLLLGHVPCGACEIEAFPRRSLLQRQRDGILPAFPIWDDIRTLDGRLWRGLVDIVAGGFPCVDISSAGRGAGIGGERSGLWKEMLRIIGEIRPRYAFLENSPLVVGRGLAVIIGDLAEIGYDLRWDVLGSDEVGGAHHRKRFWGLATDSMRLRQPRQGGCFQPLHKPPTDDRKTDWFVNVLQGRAVPYVCRENHGMADGMDRLTALGNGQDPRVAARAWQILTTYPTAA